MITKVFADAVPKEYRNVGLLDFDFDHFSEITFAKQAMNTGFHLEIAKKTLVR